MKQLTTSYKTLRTLIGVWGILFPIVLAVGGLIECTEIQQSISVYYHTIMRNIFVGFLFIISAFFISYKGYSEDRILNAFIAILALIVALSPTSFQKPYTSCLTMNIDKGIWGIVHLVAAGSLFACFLIYISRFLRDSGKYNPQKVKRNQIYFWSFTSMLFIMVLFSVAIMLKRIGKDIGITIFILETLFLWIFGFSWLTKGGLLFPDKKQEANINLNLLKAPKKEAIKVNDPDLYNGEDNERTLARLNQLKSLGVEFLPGMQFGIAGYFSGLYIENVWNYSNKQWNDYLLHLKDILKKIN